ncbi:MAG: CoA-binding protein [Halobacteria archaeon]
MTLDKDKEIEDVLGKKTIAVVGCSSTPGKAAHDVPEYLKSHGYTVVPVNPYSDEILGEKSYDSLYEAAKDHEIDVVEVFRPSEEVSGIVDEVLDLGDVDVFWMQTGIMDVDSAERAEKEGIDVVMDRCMKVEHGRLMA